MYSHGLPILCGGELVWLYLPSTALPFLPESEDWNWALEHLTIESTPFVMSRGKPMQLPQLLRKWKKDSWMKHLFGLTLKHSTAMRGVEKWIGSLPVSPVNRSQMLVNKKGQKMNDGFGKISSELLTKLDRSSSFWKTLQHSLIPGMQCLPYLEPWPKAGSMLSGNVSKRKMSEPITTETGSFFLPTPTAHPENKSSKEWGYPTLIEAAEMWPTPRTCSAMASRITSEIAWNPKRSPNLETVVGKRMFPTPTVHDSKNNGGQSQMVRNTPPLNAQIGGKLNPPWVDWLMGFPIGWTALEPPEMELSLYRQRMRFMFSQLKQALDLGVNE